MVGTKENVGRGVKMFSNSLLQDLEDLDVEF